MTSTVRSISDWLKAKPALLLTVLLLCTTLPLRGQQQPEAQPQQTPQQETQQETNQKIQQLAALASTRPHDVPVGAGDLLHIDVFDVPELSRDVRVSDLGDISYPLIPGKIQAAGLTPFQLEEKMEQLLIENGLVTHPQVSVFVREQTSQPVSVVGAVSRPSVYWNCSPTLVELLMKREAPFWSHVALDCRRQGLSQIPRPKSLRRILKRSPSVCRICWNLVIRLSISKCSGAIWSPSREQASYM
jgi:hypothetical protein